MLLLLDLYDVPSVVVSLPGLGICIILAIFCNMCEIVLSEMLNIVVRYVSVVFPTCLRCLVLYQLAKLITEPNYNCLRLA